MYEVPRVVKLIEMERVELTRGWGSEHMGSYYLMGVEFLFEKMKKFLKWIVVMFAQCHEHT